MSKMTKDQIETLKRRIWEKVSEGGYDVNLYLLNDLYTAAVNEIYKQELNVNGKPFETLGEWMLHPPPGLDIPQRSDGTSKLISYDQIRMLAQSHHPDLLALIDSNPPPRGKQGRKRKGKENAAARQHLNGHDRGRTTEVLASRLATEHPKFYAGFRNGTYKSIRAAAEAAGLVKPGHDPLMRLKAYWKKASPEQKEAFRNWLKTSEAKHGENRNGKP